jgi:hypothetical protein
LDKNPVRVLCENKIKNAPFIPNVPLFLDKFCNQIRVTTQAEKRMSSGTSLTSKLYDKIIKMLSKSHETIPLSPYSLSVLKRAHFCSF